MNIDQIEQELNDLHAREREGLAVLKSAFARAQNVGLLTTPRSPRIEVLGLMERMGQPGVLPPGALPPAPPPVVPTVPAVPADPPPPAAPVCRQGSPAVTTRREKVNGKRAVILEVISKLDEPFTGATAFTALQEHYPDKVDKAIYVGAALVAFAQCGWLIREPGRPGRGGAATYRRSANFPTDGGKSQSVADRYGAFRQSIAVLGSEP